MSILKSTQQGDVNEPQPYDELELKGSDVVDDSDGDIADEYFDEEDIADADGVAVIDDESDFDDEQLEEEENDDTADLVDRHAV